MHLTDPEKGVMVTTGIVGSSMPIATGLGWGIQLDQTDQVAVATFGDAASNIGAFHESMNLASVWKLPVIFLCQNNRYGEHTKMEKATAVGRIADRATAYSMPGIHVDGNDPWAMYAAAKEAVDRARAGEGPTLIEAMTFRFHGHVFGDDDAYMDEGEKAAAMAADPYPAFRNKLIEQGIAGEEQLAQIESEAEEEIKAAIEFGLASPLPELDELTTDVFGVTA